MAHPRAPEQVRAFIAAPPLWLIIQPPIVLLALPKLDPGEIAAISLAVELRASVMIDERAGRDAAIAEGLDVIGAVGVLERGANMGFIADLQIVHDRIRSMRFHINDRILKASLERHRSNRVIR